MIKRFQTILDNTKDMMFIKNADLIYVAASRAFVKMVGKESADEIINRTDLEIFAPILMNLVSQLLAYYMTIAKGYNVDQPRNLAKSVTVE